MPHQCVKCSRIIPLGSKELLEGCDICGGKFFFYVKEDQLEKIKERKIEIPEVERDSIEKDIREIIGAVEEDTPVILDLESVRVIGDGKFEIDLVNVFNKKRPLIYKLEEGKYLIDLASTLQRNVKDLKEIQNPNEKG
jgi:predicted  nucleic acid-binding Zn-ribbon protein